MQGGGTEEEVSCREEQREGSNARRGHRERNVLQGGAERRESCREEQREGSHARGGGEKRGEPCR